jgi:hypothetical protein
MISLNQAREHLSISFNNSNSRIESGTKGNPGIIWTEEDPRNLVADRTKFVEENKTDRKTQNRVN